MTQTVLAAAAAIGAVINLCLLAIHCRRDKREFAKRTANEDER